MWSVIALMVLSAGPSPSICEGWKRDVGEEGRVTGRTQVNAIAGWPLLSLFESVYVQVLLDFLKLRQHFLIISGPDLALKCCQY